MTKNRDIRHELEHRILLLDGGFGTMIQQYGLDEADYRGKEFAASEKLLRGCNDLLNPVSYTHLTLPTKRIV